MNEFQAALAALIAADKHLLDLHASNAVEVTYRAAYDAKSRAIADLNAVLDAVSQGTAAEVIQLAEAA